MNRVIFCGIILAFTSIAAGPLVIRAQQTAQAAAPEFTISGNVKGLAESSSVYLTDVSNPGDTLAETIVKGGQFVLSGHVAEPNLFEVNFGGAGKKTPLFMGNDKISLSGSVVDLKSIKATGSPSNDDFLEFQGTFNPYFARLNTVIGMANSPTGAKNKDSLFRVYKKLADSVQNDLDRYIQKKRSSYVSAFVLVVLAQITEDVV